MYARQLRAESEAMEMPVDDGHGAQAEAGESVGSSSAAPVHAAASSGDGAVSSEEKYDGDEEDGDEEMGERDDDEDDGEASAEECDVDPNESVYDKAEKELARLDLLSDFLLASGADIVCLYEVQCAVGLVKRSKRKARGGTVSADIKVLLYKLTASMDNKSRDQWATEISPLNCAGSGTMRDAYVLLCRVKTRNIDVPVIFRDSGLSIIQLDKYAKWRMPGEIRLRARWHLHETPACLRLVLWHAPTFGAGAIPAMKKLLEYEQARPVDDYCTVIAGDLNIDGDYDQGALVVPHEETVSDATHHRAFSATDGSEEPDEDMPLAPQTGSGDDAKAGTYAAEPKRSNKNLTQHERAAIEWLWQQVEQRYFRCAPRGGTTMNLSRIHINSQRGSTANALDHVLLELRPGVEFVMSSIHDLLFHAMENITIPEVKEFLSEPADDETRHKLMNHAFREARRLVYRNQFGKAGVSDHHAIAVTLLWKCPTQCIILPLEIED